MDIDIKYLMQIMLSGAAGGLVSFLAYTYTRKDAEKGKVNISKLIVEIAGASITSFFIVPLFPFSYQLSLAFFIGLTWSKIVLNIQKRTPTIIEALIKGLFDKNKGIK